MRHPATLATLIVAGLAGGCSTFDAPTAACPDVAIIKGLERVELNLSRNGVEAALNFNLGPIDGSCLIADDFVELDYAFDIQADNVSPFAVDGLVVDFFIAVLDGGEVIEKFEFTSQAMDLAAGATVTVRESFNQRLILAENEIPADFDFLVGLSLPKEIGLRQRSGF